MPNEPTTSGQVFGKTDFFVIAAALVSFVLSVYLWFTGQREEGLFVGLWVPSILGFAIFVKLQLRGR